MGKIKKGVTCNVAGCTESAERSLSRDNLAKPLNEAGLQVRVVGNRVYLCEKHYKSVKKQLKKTRKEELLRFEKPF
jgi:hypothetical protein